MRWITIVVTSLVLVGVLLGGPSWGEDPPAEQEVVHVGEARASLLRRLHFQADEASGLAHLAARVAADEAFPLPYLGVDADPDATAQGMRIRRVYPATCAEEAGLQVGDVILALDGEATPSTQALGRALRARRPGRSIRLRILKGAETTTLDLVLGQRPEDNDDDEEPVPMHGTAFGAASRTTLAFDAAQPGETPAGLDVLLGGHGEAPRWVVAQEGGATFLRQAAADITGIRYPMAWAADFHARDALVRVRFRLVSGKQDRAAGIVVRGQDRWTYLVARANGAEGDLCLFRCAHGRRQLLPGGRVAIDLSAGGWHTLEVRAQGARISATLDGTTTVASHDTYVRGWHVGLWTKSDAVTDFDDFSAQGLPAEDAR